MPCHESSFMKQKKKWFYYLNWSTQESSDCKKKKMGPGYFQNSSMDLNSKWLTTLKALETSYICHHPSWLSPARPSKLYTSLIHRSCLHAGVFTDEPFTDLASMPTQGGVTFSKLVYGLKLKMTTYFRSIKNLTCIDPTCPPKHCT